MSRVIVSIAILLALPGSALAQDDKGFVSYRQNVMEGMGHDTGAIGDILKNGLPLQKNIPGHARSIAEHARLISAAFEKKALGAPNDAQPAIWQDWAKFQEAATAFQAEADKFVAAAQTGDPGKIGAGMNALGKACGNCHETYRKPKEESYKRTNPGHH
jgi:cytochrome c556